MASAMLRLLRQMMGRMGVAGAVVMALAFATPAFASHACIDESCAPAGSTAFAAPVDAEDGCPDCGPACANGCCHAPHPATTPGLAQPDAPIQTATSAVWTHAALPPLVRPSDPDRPPRA